MCPRVGGEGPGTRLGSSMSAHRKHVFTEKVLKRLFPNDSRGQEKETLQTPQALETPSKIVTPEAVQHRQAHSLTDGDIKIQAERRVYTVSLPPQGYIPCLQEQTSCASPENASSGGDTEDLDLHDQPKRRRIRKRKSKKKMKNPNDVILKQAELEQQPGLFQEKVHPQHIDAPTMSKNKRKKLKKKLQLRRKKAAGLVTKASGVTFTYQPESPGEAGVDGASGEESGDDHESAAADTTQEDAELANSKADTVLSFLKSTQEIYFYDDTSKDLDPAVCTESADELLHALESGRMPPADVLLLDHMKSLLLLQDRERLESALKLFPEHCLMPPEHARVISAFFNYWITQILPEKNNE
ncbi:glutamate-rich protein 1 isoform X3 [Meriones unguiculatus]|uniref:glutamate-rich protein 1 isoform X3 n=1 Tax=Meriones unguiculatus TaxID=10047 RepID=UPI000B4F4A87|nr:glutamate-rich protein 1 isoform X3 [Meriones unguiculatus]